jgi:hypothetical protein
MNIKEGYNGKPLTIRISGRRNQSSELWLTQEGLPEEIAHYRETLSYVSIQELVDLKREIEDAILDATGITREF